MSSSSAHAALAGSAGGPQPLVGAAPSTYELSEIEALPTTVEGFQCVGMVPFDQYVHDRHRRPALKFPRFTAVAPCQFDSESEPVEGVTKLPARAVVKRQHFVVPPDGNAPLWADFWAKLREQYPAADSFLLALSVVVQLSCMTSEETLPETAARSFCHAPDWVRRLALVRVDADGSDKRFAQGDVLRNAKGVAVSYGTLIFLSEVPQDLLADGAAAGAKQ